MKLYKRKITASTDSRDYSKQDVMRKVEDLAYDLGVAVDFHEVGKFGGHYRYLVDLVFDIYDGADIIDTCGILIRNDEPKTYVLYGNLKRSIQCLTLDKALDFLESYIRKITL